MSKLLHLYVLAAVLSFKGFCQNSEKQSLKTVLHQLESIHKVRFSYDNEILKNIYTFPIPLELSLNDALNSLQLSTQLEFKVLSKRFIAIVEPKLKALDQLQQLDEVIIEDYLNKSLSKTITGTVDFNTSSYDIFPGLIEPDVFQTIQQLPGIISVEERISNLNIRGGTNDQNLIIYDGIRMFQNGHFFGLISAFNPQIIQNVSIAKNGTSARYGEAVSGVISILSDDTISSETHSGIGLNLINADAYTKIPLSKNMQLQLSARRSFTDLLVSRTYDAYFERIFRSSELNINGNNAIQLALDERFLFYDINAKYVYDIDKSSKLQINFINLYNNLDYNQTFSQNNSAIQDQKSELQQVSYGISATYKKQWSKKVQTNFEGYYSSYTLDAFNETMTNNQRIVQENAVEDIGFRFDISKKSDQNLKFLNGYQYNQVSVTNFEDITNPVTISLQKEIIRSHSFYSQTELYSNSKLTYVRLGIRGNYFEKFGKVIVEPRVALNQKLFKHLRLELLAESKSQSLTQVLNFNQDFFGIETRRWQLANDNEVPIMINSQISLGLSYNKENLLITTEGYYKKVDNISSKSQGFQNQFQFVNDIGNYSVFGVDVLVNKKFNTLNTWLSYSYSKNNYEFNNLNDGNLFANNLDLRHTANSSVTYSFKNFKLGLSANWHSGRAYTSPSLVQIPNNSRIEYNSPNADRLSDYFRTDFSILYNFKSSSKMKAQVGASIWNLFNTSNSIRRYYVQNNDESISEIDILALQFTPNLSLRLDF